MGGVARGVFAGGVPRAKRHLEAVMELGWPLDAPILAEGQELSRRKSSDFRGEATPPSVKSGTPLRGEVKSLRRGVASLADTQGIGFATLLAAKRFDLIQTLSKVHNSL